MVTQEMVVVAGNSKYSVQCERKLFQLKAISQEYRLRLILNTEFACKLIRMGLYQDNYPSDIVTKMRAWQLFIASS